MKLIQMKLFTNISIENCLEDYLSKVQIKVIAMINILSLLQLKPNNLLLSGLLNSNINFLKMELSIALLELAYKYCVVIIIPI